MVQAIGGGLLVQAIDWRSVISTCASSARRCRDD